MYPPEEKSLISTSQKNLPTEYPPTYAHMLEGIATKTQYDRYDGEWRAHKLYETGQIGHSLRCFKVLHSLLLLFQ